MYLNPGVLKFLGLIYLLLYLLLYLLVYLLLYLLLYLLPYLSEVKILIQSQIISST